MKVFITGGTGFIGKHLVRRMSLTDHELYCLARKTSDAVELNELGAHIVIGDVTDRASLREGMRGCHWVVNLANVYSMWEPDRDIFRRVNVEGTRNVMECALETGISKVVHVSTIGVYGHPEESPIREETPVAPSRLSEYSRTKYEGEQITWQLYREKGLPLVVIYPCGVVGSGDTKMAGGFIQRLVNRRAPARIFKDTKATYVHVKDVAEAILKAAEKSGNLGEKYIIGNTSLSFGELYALVSDVSGVAPPKPFMPDSLVMFNARVLTWIADRIKRPPLWDMSIDAALEFRLGWVADGSKAERELGLVYTPIRQAIEDECAWFRMSAADRIRARQAQSAQAWKGAERRTQERAKTDLPCDVEGVAHGQKTSAKARVADISRLGMFIESDAPLDEGTDVNAHITAIQFGETFWVMGKVLRRASKGMAIGFTENVPREIERVLTSGRK